VFVVETKNMKGWIFGSATQPFWTQKIFRSNYKFQNPLHQNYKHVKTLQALPGLGDQPALRQPEDQTQPKAAAETADIKMKLDTVIQRVYQPPSELFLARQECNSLIAAVMGNQDARLLRERDRFIFRHRSCVNLPLSCPFVVIVSVCIILA
jgi:hypothetical protein